MADTRICDLAIVGGGLAGGLIALALAKRHPGLDVVLVDSGERIGGNHIWSFFGDDIAEEHRWLVAPLVCHAWPGYRIAFPQAKRKLGTPYYTILSDRLDAEVRAAIGDGNILTGVTATTISRVAALLDDGSRIQAKAVIDARGGGDYTLLDSGWQKFVGQIVRTAAPHGVTLPVVMDATVEQIDGYRFVYLLPFADDLLLIEDTYYSDGPELDRDALAGRIADYAAAKGWTITEVEREETGVLPVVMDGDFDAYWRAGAKDVGKVGARAGLFHPTTGYSLPDAVRTAMLIADLENPASRGLHELLFRYARTTWAERGFYRMLDKMLFRGAEPEERYKVLQRFYQLNRPLISRFYAAKSTFRDKARVLVGKPPIPISRAIRVIR
jgi:lycopene beta-cyclase